MGIYLLKFTTCLAVLYFFYKVCLENEHMHVFKRVYLLVSLAAALIIPAVVFTEYVEVQPLTNDLMQEYSIPQATDDPIGIPMALEKDVLDLAPILWTIYFIGVLFFGIKFLKNLYQILKRINKNPKQKWEQFIHVLLKDPLPPHTFLSYIFLNRQKFEASEIPQEVLLHEQTHARQKHSYDILFVEFLQVVFWINPFIYLIKKAIKLNHEFLADEAVLNENISKVNYQNTLLSYLSVGSENKHQSPLVNPINYSSIKKRFKIMKTQTSKKAVLLRSILVLPLLAVLTYSFSETAIVPIEKDDIKEELINLNELDINYSNNHTERKIQLGGIIMDSETLKPLANAEFRDANGNVLSTTDKNGYYNVALQVSGEGELIFDFSLYKEGYQPLLQKERWGNLPGKIGSSYYFGLKKEGSESKEISELGELTTNLSYEAVLSKYAPIKARIDLNKKISIVRKNTKHSFIEIDKHFYIVSNAGWLRINSKQDLIFINDSKTIPASQLNNHITRNDIVEMTPLENDQAHFAIYVLNEEGSEKYKKRASKDEIQKFNRLALSYNNIPIDQRTIPISNLSVLESIYKKMTLKQKQESVPFPECLPKNKQEEVILISETIEIRINKNGQLLIKDKLVPLNNLATVLKSYNKDMSLAERKSSVASIIYIDENSPKAIINKASQALTDYGVATIDIKKVFPPDYTKYQNGISSKELTEYNKLAKHYNSMPHKQMKIYKKDVERLEYLFSKMSDSQKANAEPFPDFPEPPPVPKAPKATNEREEALHTIETIIEEQDPYDVVNTGIRINSKGKKVVFPENTRVYMYNAGTTTKTSSVLMKYLGSKDLKNAQFYFEGEKISSKEGLEIIENNEDIKVETIPHTNKQPEVRIYKAESKGTIPPPPHSPHAPEVLKGERSDIPPPPMPPKPVSPLDHVIAMAKKDAQFLYEGTEISSDKAIELMKNNKDLNIDSRATNGKRPVVKIAASPITN